MWDHLREVLDDPHALVIANPPTYFSGYEKFYDTQGKMTWKEPPYQMFDPATGQQQLYDLCMNSKALVVCYHETVSYTHLPVWFTRKPRKFRSGGRKP